MEGNRVLADVAAVLAVPNPQVPVLAAHATPVTGGDRHHTVDAMGDFAAYLLLVLHGTFSFLLLVQVIALG
jgi:hypothetical protein